LCREVTCDFRRFLKIGRVSVDCTDYSRETIVVYTQEFPITVPMFFIGHNARLTYAFNGYGLIELFKTTRINGTGSLFVCIQLNKPHALYLYRRCKINQYIYLFRELCGIWLCRNYVAF